MRQGFGFIRGNRNASLILLAFLATMLGVPLMVFLPCSPRTFFRQGPTIYTLLLAFSVRVRSPGRCRGGHGQPSAQRARDRDNDCRAGSVHGGFLALAVAAHECVLVFMSGALTIEVFATLGSLVQLLTAR
jgi:hypothetical protein